jgi:hypothetical protein
LIWKRNRSRRLLSHSTSEKSKNYDLATMASVRFCLLTVVVLLFANLKFAEGFSITNGASRSICRSKGVNLYMGRAAAVRAATKSRTDGAKAKNNSR